MLDQPDTMTKTGAEEPEPAAAPAEAAGVDALKAQRFELEKKLAAAELKLAATEVALGEAESRLANLEQMIDQMPINVITCDRETFEIDYANQTTKDTIKTLEHLLPVKADQLLELFDPCHEFFPAGH